MMHDPSPNPNDIVTSTIPAIVTSSSIVPVIVPVPYDDYEKLMSSKQKLKQAEKQIHSLKRKLLVAEENASKARKRIYVSGNEKLKMAREKMTTLKEIVGTDDKEFKEAEELFNILQENENRHEKWRTDQMLGNIPDLSLVEIKAFLTNGEKKYGKMVNADSFKDEKEIVKYLSQALKINDDISLADHYVREHLNYRCSMEYKFDREIYDYEVQYTMKGLFIRLSSLPL